MRSSIPQVTAETIDFVQLAQAPDEAIIQRYSLLVRLSKKPLFDSKVKFNACQVGREPQRLIVRLMNSVPGKQSQIVAQVCFVPVSVSLLKGK